MHVTSLVHFMLSVWRYVLIVLTCFAIPKIGFHTVEDNGSQIHERVDSEREPSCGLDVGCHRVITTRVVSASPKAIRTTYASFLRLPVVLTSERAFKSATACWLAGPPPLVGVAGGEDDGALMVVGGQEGVGIKYRVKRERTKRNGDS
jgi:hypothetical protein